MAVRIASQSDRNPPSRGVDRQNALVGRRVIVVDDSVSQRRRISEIFEGLGMQVIGEASNGLECLALAEKTRPDVISLDVIMPVMHGVETLGYLRESKSSAVIVYVSILGNLETMTEVKAPGGHLPDAIFSKKDGPETFLEVLTSIFVGEEDSNRLPVTKVTEEGAPPPSQIGNGKAVS
ncbi:MAG: response regulator [Silvanigrellaceae bacterium]